MSWRVLLLGMALVSSSVSAFTIVERGNTGGTTDCYCSVTITNGVPDLLLQCTATTGTQPDPNPSYSCTCYGNSYQQSCPVGSYGTTHINPGSTTLCDNQTAVAAGSTTSPCLDINTGKAVCGGGYGVVTVFSENDRQDQPSGVVDGVVTPEVISCWRETKRYFCTDTKSCPVDCVQSDWTNGTCTGTCGTGYEIDTRTTIQRALNGGTPCGPLTRNVSCSLSPCPIDCVSAYGNFSTCNATCGGGMQNASLYVVSPAQYGGNNCTLGSMIFQSCNTNPCPVNCVVSNWSAWSACNATCGTGITVSNRSILVAPAYGGTACPSLINYTTCSASPCPVDCVVSAWSSWSPCTVSCGGGFQNRTRTVVTPAANGGIDCPALNDTQVCNTNPCPIDCVVSNWSSWSACNATCGGGVSVSNRSILVAAQYGGTACPTLINYTTCATNPCPVDCVVSAWSSWSACNVSCGGGIQTRTRTVTTPAANGGTACPTLTDSQTCNTSPCPIDCVVSAWSNFTVCNATCGGGIQTRNRTIATPPQYGGAACPALNETATCNTSPCPINCTVSDWGDWGICSLFCGGGTQTRIRVVLQAPLYGGTACPSLTDSQTCNTQSCVAGDCQVSDWSDYSTCSVSCGGGTQTRTRTILVPQTTGLPCPNITDTRACNPDACEPENCVASLWSAWSTCNATCGGGFQNRTRTIVIPAKYGGTNCTLLQMQVCNKDPCPVDCIVSNWSIPTPCSVSCGGGVSLSNRTILTAAAHGGVACPTNLTLSTTCNTDACAGPLSTAVIAGIAVGATAAVAITIAAIVHWVHAPLRAAESYKAIELEH